MAHEEAGHGHGGHGATAVEAAKGDGEHHAGHGHGDHESGLTRELSGTLGVIAAFGVALLGVVIDKTVGPLFSAAHESEAQERRPLPAAQLGAAQLLVVNAKVVQPGYETASVIAVADGKILGVGGDELLDRRTPETVVEDLHGQYVIPGLRDAHGSLALLGRKISQRECDLTADEVNASEGDVVRTFEAWKRIHKADAKVGDWLFGYGWDEAKWKTYRAPSREELIKAEKEGRDFRKEPHQGYIEEAGKLPESTDLLDVAAPDNPVVLHRREGRVVWVNKAALLLAGITPDTFNPPGGHIKRNATGGLSGVLEGSAVDLVLSKVPHRKEDEIIHETEEDMLLAARACARAGLVEVHTGIDRVEEYALRDLAKRGQLPIRVYAMVTGDMHWITERLTLQNRSPAEPVTDLLTIRAVELFADGALENRGARLLEPYSDDATTSGLVRTAPGELKAIAEAAYERGWQLCVHCAGDAATRDVLSLYEEVLHGKRDRRWRIEHAQVIDPSDRPRFEKLGVVACVDPAQVMTDMEWAEARLGKERLAGAFAWRSLLEEGVPLAFGSSFPRRGDRPVDPLVGLYAAVTRQNERGEPAGGWLPHQKISAGEALALFTDGPAYASFAEARRGKILPGMDADLTVLDRDPLEVLEKKPRELLSAKVIRTFVAGKDLLR
jgi:predicted amidohydrolase YtcJ